MLFTMKILIPLLATLVFVNCQLPPHPEVVAVRQQEEFLPPHLRSSALRNPNLRELLSLTSLLHKGEMPVYDRPTQDVSRQKIFMILTHAGLVSRRFHQPADFQQLNHGHINVEPDFHNPELLQYL